MIIIKKISVCFDEKLCFIWSWDNDGCNYYAGGISILVNLCPAEPRYALPLQTV